MLYGFTTDLLSMSYNGHIHFKFLCNLTGVLVKVNPQYFRPTEVELLWGNPTKIKEKLGWKLRVDFDV